MLLGVLYLARARFLGLDSKTVLNPKETRMHFGRAQVNGVQFSTNDRDGYKIFPDW